MRKKITIALVFVFATAVSLGTTNVIAGKTPDPKLLAANILDATAPQPEPVIEILPTEIVDTTISSKQKTEDIVPTSIETVVTDEEEIRINSEEPVPTTKKIHECPKPLGEASGDTMLLPVGPDYSVGDYIPPGLVPVTDEINTWGRKLCLLPEVVSALKAMNEAAKNDGANLVAISAFRTNHTQAQLKKREEGLNYTYPSIADPGHSEHQLGTTVDFSSVSNSGGKLSQFGGSAEYQWMRAHAHTYGFVQSYTPGTEPITGYRAESWHWRYVGTDIATSISNGQLTLYEYLKNIQIGG